MGKEIDLDKSPVLKALLQAALDEAGINQEAVALFPKNMLLAAYPGGHGFAEWQVERGDDEAFHLVGI